MAKIAIAVIGAGLIGRKHLAKIAEHPDFVLAGIADVNTDAVAKQYPNARVFADHRRLLDEARPDAAIIASPNQAHAEIGIDCARRGVHILVEKPVTDTLDAATQLIAEVKKAGVKSLVGHHRRHHRQVRTLQTLLKEGRIGNLVGVSAIWSAYKPDAYFAAGPWRTQPGGGPILINLIHEIDFLRFTVGEIVAVSALASNRQRKHAVEDTAAALIEFENGALGTFFASDSAVSPWTTEQGVGESPEFPYSGQSSYRFMGNIGALEFPNLVHWSQAGGTPTWNQPILSRTIHAPTLDAYIAQLDHFRDVIHGKTESIQTVEDGAKTLRATLAVTQAAARETRVILRDV
jgi:predicted dehydrogenase